MLLISSMITTVLPTPAPPKAPTLPPLRNGHTRSITLMPVGSTSGDVDWSTSAGAGRWIGYRFSAFTGPRSSTGSPVTSNTRPITPSPTGTEIGAPVSWTRTPRRKPSVPDIEIARTQLSPRCCWTSRVSFTGFSCTS
jgi:hypothetical protein